MENKWLRAFERTLFLGAFVHLTLIAIQAFRTGDWQLVHLSSILDLQFFFDNVSYSPLTNLLLFIPIALVFFINLYLFGKAGRATK